MTAYFIRRFLLMVPTFLGVTIIAFTLTRLVPGGPLERQIMQLRQGAAANASGAMGGSVIDPLNSIPQAAINEMKKAFDLDKPGYVAYFLWVKRVLTLDLGNSYRYRKPVWELIAQRIPISLTFGFSGFVLAYLISVPLGIFKALRHRSAFDFISSAIVFVGYSIPGWALGALLLVFLASGRFWDVFPLGDIRTGAYQDLPALVKVIDDAEAVRDEFGSFEWDRLSPMSKLIDRAYHMALPVFCYMMASFATITILTKNSLLENLSQDYVRTAFAKGLSPLRVIFLHTLRNSLIPLATNMGHALSYLMAGSYLIEWVFNIDGIGYLGYTSIVERDYTVVLGILSINTILILLGNVLSDVLYALIDPRIRFEQGSLLTSPASVSPLRQRIRRFRRLKRGYYSFVLLVGSYVLTFFLPFLMNSRAIVVRYDGQLLFPAARCYLYDTFGIGSELIYLGERFGQTDASGRFVQGEAKYRELKTQFSADGEGNFVWLPPIPYDPFEQFLELEGNPPHRPSRVHWFGTDDRGRDVLVRLVYGYRISISFALVVTLAAYSIGIVLGALLGYYGRWLDILGLRFVEIWGAVPFLYTVIILASIFSPSFLLLASILAAFGWMQITYYVRGEFYREKAKDYVAAALATGEGNLTIVLRHILPNALTPIITFAPFAIVGAIVSLVSLDFLGFGLSPPTPSWGELLSQAKQNLKVWHLVVFPLGAMFLTLQLIVFIGEAVREAFDPKVLSRLR